jgi:hypothetical protein
MITFYTNGNLKNDIALSYGALRQHFGFSEIRNQLMVNLLPLLKTLVETGCKEIFIAGSFASIEAAPGDIDICINAADIDVKQLYAILPGIFTDSGIAKLKQEQGIHIAIIYDQYTKAYLNDFKNDRDKNPRGMIRIDLEDINEL